MGTAVRELDHFPHPPQGQHSAEHLEGVLIHPGRLAPYKWSSFQSTTSSLSQRCQRLHHSGIEVTAASTIGSATATASTDIASTTESTTAAAV
mmetsp:Transcript_40473/g.86347  ORF Transcript_40473/g.86347 Transcript_40473/m.86347 type:complete len:93 (-) Transcript_40473:8-286(-)